MNAVMDRRLSLLSRLPGAEDPPNDPKLSGAQILAFVYHDVKEATAKFLADPWVLVHQAKGVFQEIVEVEHRGGLLLGLVMPSNGLEIIAFSVAEAGPS